MDLTLTSATADSVVDARGNPSDYPVDFGKEPGGVRTIQVDHEFTVAINWLGEVLIQGF
jgi:hypothetical protein